MARLLDHHFAEVPFGGLRSVRPKLHQVKLLPASALKGSLLLAPLGIVVLLLLLTPAPLLFIPASDVLVYERYGGQLLAGAIPNRDFAVEYPPLALLPMALPKMIWPFGGAGDLGYTWAFTLIEGTLACLTGWLITRVSEHPIGALVTWVALVLAGATPVAWRYDLWPAVLVLAALVAADRGRPGVAGVAIGAGVMLKLFPLVVLPILAARSIALREWNGLLRLLLGSALVIGSVMAVSIALTGPGAFHWVSYQINRGLQIETTAAGLFLLLHLVDGLPVTVGQAFGSMQVTAPSTPGLLAATLVALPILTIVLAGLVSVLAYTRFRRDRASLGRVPLSSVALATVAVLVALLVTSKVFSVQYVVWFLPLVPLLAWPGRWLGLAIAALSAVIYPLNYAALWQLDPILIVILNARNLVLVGFLVWLAADLAHQRGNPTRQPDAEPQRGRWSPADVSATPGASA